MIRNQFKSLQVELQTSYILNVTEPNSYLQISPLNKALGKSATNAAGSL